MGMAAADYEDVSGQRQRFLAFCPAYDMMTQGQLRTYFAWRTDVRRAIAAAQPVPRPVSSSYAVLYLMELVNGIGTSGPEESYQTAQNFWEAYRRFDFTIDRLAMSWLQDLADFWGLVGEQLSQNQWAPSNAPNDQQLRALIDCQAALGDDLAIGGLLFTLSDYAPEKMRFSSVLGLHRLQSRKAWIKSASQSISSCRDCLATMGTGRSSFTALKDAQVRRGSETSAFSERSL